MAITRSELIAALEAGISPQPDPQLDVPVRIGNPVPAGPGIPPPLKDIGSVEEREGEVVLVPA